MGTEYYGNTVVGLKLSSNKIRKYLIENKSNLEPFEFIDRLNLGSDNDDDENYFITNCEEHRICIDVKHGTSHRNIPLLTKDDYLAIELGIKMGLDKINQKMGWVGNLWDDNDFKIWCFGHSG